MRDQYLVESRPAAETLHDFSPHGHKEFGMNNLMSWQILAQEDGSGAAAGAAVAGIILLIELALVVAMVCQRSLA